MKQIEARRLEIHNRYSKQLNRAFDAFLKASKAMPRYDFKGQRALTANYREWAAEQGRKEKAEFDELEGCEA